MTERKYLIISNSNRELENMVNELYEKDKELK